MSFAPLRHAVLLLILFAVIGGITLVPGVLRVTGHEFDLVHTLDIAYRLVEGDRPHADVMTPLGILSIYPIVAFLKAGFGPGTSYLMAQILVTGVLLPGIWWIGVSRLEGRLRAFYGISMVLLGLSLIFGNDNPSITAAMYYNRWAWILASFVMLIVMMRPRAGWDSALVDGLILGGAGAALGLIKVTYVFALVPVVVIFILSERDWRRLGFALAGALAVLAVPTVGYGPGFWGNYAADLLAVAGGEMRAFPGVEFGDIVASPAHLSKTLLLIAAIVFWRKTGRMTEGLRLLILGPGLIYITYQNWGNDPKWLFFLALMLLALPPREADKPVFGVPALAASRVMALICLVLYLPSMITIGTSSFRHLVLNAELYSPLFKDEAKRDIEIQTLKSYTPGAAIPIEDVPFPDGYVPEEEIVTSVELNGEKLLDCSLRDGFSGWTQKMLAQLGGIEAARGARVMVTDIYDHLWLYGPFERNIGAAPWYYGTDDGIDGAELVMVPFCPMAPDARRRKLELIAERGWRLDEVARTDLFILFRPAG